ncbi:cytochrome b561 transmembrane protein [Cupriavidus basilensis OR16]|uniref:Cytochrome b561 transmembrane protein n=1 Tax=Cupriavidus basilensis OR16 TaxID=1127483 RepID=H1RZP6_9BURK|nr:cytochrome b [Cupriavidus basilensis]EHP44112.1 cytochrome b561 transmembrane protein [Cupriavidus basilensis OR16]
MTSINNTEGHYGVIAILFHWSMAFLVIGLAALGLYMVTLPDVGFNTKKIVLILYHKEVGILAFVLLVARLGWRVTQVLPQLVAHLPDWQKIAARFVHLCFYALLIALPISGWVMSSAAGIPVSFFGLFTLPDLVDSDDYLFHRFIELHKWLGYVLILLIFVHVGAALRHHFVFKDDTLRRMLP